MENACVCHLSTELKEFAQLVPKNLPMMAPLVFVFEVYSWSTTFALHAQITLFTMKFKEHANALRAFLKNTLIVRPVTTLVKLAMVQAREIAWLVKENELSILLMADVLTLTILQIDVYLLSFKFCDSKYLK